jgi:dynein heavy chain
LLPKEELDMIINDIRPIMKAAQPGVPDTWDNLYSFFLNRVRDNLHVMLCFSPVGDKFARRAMQFPGLINGCTIDWFLPWPEEALTSGGRASCSACCCGVRRTYQCSLV